jgi:excisionase family DNA binding protein
MDSRPGVKMMTATPAAEVADLLGMNVKSVYEGAAKGEIPARRVGRRWVFPPRDELLRWLAGQERAPAQRRSISDAGSRR